MLTVNYWVSSCVLNTASQKKDIERYRIVDDGWREGMEAEDSG